MIKAYLIDDLKTEINDLKSYFISAFKKDEFECKYENFKKCSGSDAIPFTFDSQKDKLKERLNEEWDNYDFFLVDMLLMEKSINAEKKLSLSAIEEVLKECPEKAKQIEKKEKFIIIITGHWAENLKPKKDQNPILENLLYVCKPLKKNEPQPINISFCHNFHNCNKYDVNSENLCDYNNCLKNILRTLYDGKV